MVLDAVKELGGFYVMLNKSLVGVEGTSDIGVANDFRRIGLLRNPTNFGTTTVASAAQEDNYLLLYFLLYQEHLLLMKKSIRQAQVLLVKL